MSRKILKFSAVGMFVLFFAACGDEKQTTARVYDYEKADSLSVDYLRQLGTIRVSIEQVHEFNKLLKDTDYGYDKSLLNPTSKAGNYSNSKVQAMNLGIYGADLIFAVSFGQTQDAATYLEAIVKLAKQLGVESAFDLELIEKITSNDTTINKSVLLTRAYRHLEDQMYSEDRAHLATMMVAGGWVESLYLACSKIKSEQLDQEFNTDLWDHTYTYNNVKKMLGVFKDDYKDCAEVLVELEELEKAINAITHSKYDILYSHLADLQEPLKKLRNKLVNMA